MKHLRVVYLLLILVFAVTGCMVTGFGMRTHDVTSDPSWWGELHKGEILALNQDTLLNGVELTLAASKDVPGYNSQAIFHRTITVEMFKANPGKYWEDLHLIPQGTRLRAVKLGRWFSNNSSGYCISAIFLDGDFRNKIVPLDPYGGDPKKKGSLRLGPNCLVHPVE